MRNNILNSSFITADKVKPVQCPDPNCFMLKAYWKNDWILKILTIKFALSPTIWEEGLYCHLKNIINQRLT